MRYVYDDSKRVWKLDSDYACTWNIAIICAPHPFHENDLVKAKLWNFLISPLWVEVKRLSKFLDSLKYGDNQLMKKPGQWFLWRERSRQNNCIPECDEYNRIFKYLNIQIFLIRIFIRVFVRIIFWIRIYSDIRSRQDFYSNIFGYWFVSILRTQTDSEDVFVDFLWMLYFAYG